MSTGDVRTATVRPLSTTDLDACLALAQDREWPYEDRKWEYLLRVGQGYGIDGPDGLAASAIRTTSGDLAAISMVLVAARFAGRGLGERIMRHAVAESGSATVHLHATPAGRRLYEKLDFRVLADVTAFTGTLRAPATDRTRRATPADLPAILDLDRPAFGADRSNVLSGLFDFADHVRVLERGGRITGYAAAWRAGESLPTTIIGPVVADDVAEARALITDLAADSGGPVRIDLDRANTGLVDWAAEHGLAPSFHVNLMSVDGRPLPGDRRRVHAPFMQALG
ncbi:GNAT family N-acetyltransferase [Actinokineospora sp. NBRC 105648]|uniref:GNAT family N-acetyltransferase n=1 Tax=Actinokineospora sp. NBRC 105648 TaxID=3032206 RepID=UPI0024A014D2|nr:GNAT family N-acetyltransferase [Actinokineospora sp. NBRC 105648]GLZ38251.1 acetyltransferase [Actinokineospora sp. NBRC 105648]